jgi:hypothetical protein
MLLYTIALFLVMELMSNNVVDIIVYGASTGIPNLALLVAAAPSSRLCLRRPSPPPARPTGGFVPAPETQRFSSASGCPPRISPSSPAGCTPRLGIPSSRRC